MEAIDAHLTARQLARGNRADLLQTVKCHLATLETMKADDRAVREASARARRFVEAWDARKAGPGDVTTLLRQMAEPLGAIGSRVLQRTIAGHADAAIAAGEDLDQVQARYAALVRALAPAPARRRR
jgi:hypothetical protein